MFVMGSTNAATALTKNTAKKREEDGAARVNSDVSIRGAAFHASKFAMDDQTVQMHPTKPVATRFNAVYKPTSWRKVLSGLAVTGCCKTCGSRNASEADRTTAASTAKPFNATTDFAAPLRSGVTIRTTVSMEAMK